MVDGVSRKSRARHNLLHMKSMPVGQRFFATRFRKGSRTDEERAEKSDDL